MLLVCPPLPQFTNEDSFTNLMSTVLCATTITTLCITTTTTTTTTAAVSLDRVVGTQPSFISQQHKHSVDLFLVTYLSPCPPFQPCFILHQLLTSPSSLNLSHKLYRASGYFNLDDSTSHAREVFHGGEIGGRDSCSSIH